MLCIQISPESATSTSLVKVVVAKIWVIYPKSFKTWSFIQNHSRHGELSKLIQDKCMV